jgi:hypothetical protein
MKLEFKNNNEYYINKSKSFKGVAINNSQIIKAFDFAYDMCFGLGHHRNHRTGGQINRKKGELFSNTFQGKLSEIVLYDLFLSKGINTSEPDYSVNGKGIWDDVDLIINNKKINIKSAAFFSNLLLLETKDWNENAEYLPNKNISSSSNYDYFILVRIKPDIKNILTTNRLFYSNDIEKETLFNLTINEEWYYDIAGCSSHNTIKYIIKNNYILPQNSLLNGKIKMDAENFYIQSGDMKDIDLLISNIK